MKIGIGIPCSYWVHPEFMLNLVEIVKNTKHEVIVEKESGVRTDRNRNVILNRLMGKVDYILWLDADMLYPKDIIDTYLTQKFDLIGCLYFTREKPYAPIGYIDSGEKEKPYRPILPQMVHYDKVYDVTGLGFGGMMVRMGVYETLGKKKWHNYGRFFHIPPELRTPHQQEDALSHDLQFCKKAKSNGFKIKLHGSVRPLHIGDRFIDEQDFQAQDNIEILRFPKVLVMVVDGEDVNLIKQTAGMPCDVVLIKDKQKQGFQKTINDCISKMTDFEYYVPLSPTIVSKRGWLLEAIMCQARTGAGLVAFNDVFCMFERKWLEEIKFDLENAEKLAKEQQRFAFSEKSVILSTNPINLVKKRIEI